MITKISGRLTELSESTLTLSVGDFEHEVLVADYARRQLQGRLGDEISLHTIEYLEGNPAQGRLTPRLVGFLSPADREFFDLFCSVDGVGAKKALRAMVRPVREVAVAIEEQDTKALSGLPGIGPAAAERIVAKLRRKMPKFALMAKGEEPRATDVELDVVGEAYRALCSVGHSEAEARRLVESVTAAGKPFKDVQQLLQAVWEQTK